ncbi:MAG TPA: sugar ABC transporter permease [Jatrophihabitantaceae bacterium]
MVDTIERSAPAAARDQPRPPRRRRPRREALPYLLLAPAILFELLIHIVPMAVGVYISLLRLTQFYIHDWRHAPHAGAANYRVALNFDHSIGKSLLHSFWVTVAYTLLVLVISWVFGLAGAVFTQHSFRGRGLVRTAFLIPYALPMFAAVITWNFMLQRDTGAVNHILVDQLHVAHNRPFWLIGPNSFVSLVIVAVWRNWPFAFLVITAGLQSIRTDLYEAAALDGAGVIGQIRYVTLPMLRPVNRVLILVLFLWTFNDFTTPYTLFGKSAPHQADLISIHIYQSSFVTWNFGTGSAMSVLLLGFLLVVTAGYLSAFRGRSDDYA